jgi:hypothetical protein
MTCPNFGYPKKNKNISRIYRTDRVPTDKLGIVSGCELGQKFRVLSWDVIKIKEGEASLIELG